MVKLKNSLVILLLIFSVPLYAAVQTTVDRTELAENETLTLTFSMTGGEKAQPDLSVLENDFNIVSRSQSSAYRFVNGKASSEATLKVVLFPKHAGKITIPSFEIGKSNTLPIQIKVNAFSAMGSGQNTANTQRKLWIEMSLDDTSVYVQQQMILTVKIYQAVSLLQASLDDPQAEGLQVKKMGEDRNYQTVQNGRNIQITERRYVLFANKSGHYTIMPVKLDGSVAMGNQSFFFQNSKPIRARSNKLEVDVKAVPAQWQHSEWLPARQLILHETWSTNRFKVGEPVTRTLTLQADGLMSNQLSELFPAQTAMDGLKFYPDQAELKDQEKEGRWLSQRQEKIAVIPTRAGEFTLPAIRIAWWNTKKNRIEKAVIAAKTIQVQAAAATATNNTAIMPQAAEKTNRPTATMTATKPYWKILAIMSTTGWLLTLIFGFVFSKKRRVNSSTPITVTPNERKLKKQVIKACQSNDAKACERALLDFVQARWPNESTPPLMTLAQNSQPELATAITELQRSLYAAESADSWQGDAFLKAFRNECFDIKNQNTPANKSTLPPLYP